MISSDAFRSGIQRINQNKDALWVAEQNATRAVPPMKQEEARTRRTVPTAMSHHPSAGTPLTVDALAMPCPCLVVAKEGELLFFLCERERTREGERTGERDSVVWRPQCSTDGTEAVRWSSGRSGEGAGGANHRQEGEDGGAVSIGKWSKEKELC